MPRGTGGRLALLGALLLASGVATAGYVARRERDNAFCTSCHGPAGGGARLHEGLYGRFTSAGEPAPDLAAAHFRDATRVDCIDCHGGVGVIGRARVLALSARDTFLYVSRRYEEPRGMAFAPLRDRDCTQCHRRFDVVTAEEGEAARVPFHGRVEHHTLPMACVTCHQAHVGGDPRLRFVRDEAARPQCRRCHEDLGTEGDPPGDGYSGTGTQENFPRSRRSAAPGPAGCASVTRAAAAGASWSPGASATSTRGRCVNAWRSSCSASIRSAGRRAHFSHSPRAPWPTPW